MSGNRLSRNRRDFFISHAGRDRAWAEWVAWELTEAGYAVELAVWDWAAGQNFMLAMSDALDRADRVVALFSAAYFDRSRYTTDEWVATILHIPGMTEGRLVPVQIEDVPLDDVPPILRGLIVKDLFGLSDDAARAALLEAVEGPRRPEVRPRLPESGRRDTKSQNRPGQTNPRLPGPIPNIRNIPAHNLGFTGRDGLLASVRERLLAGSGAVVAQVLYGMSGIGKTQLAIEYAHRFAAEYDVTWWITAERSELIAEEFVDLAAELGCLSGLEPETVRRAVLAKLSERQRWLLVFDNAANPSEIAQWLPATGDGHVLITTRTRAAGWAEIAASVEVDVLARPESVAILQSRVAELDSKDADQLAEMLGDLPLAVAQAAAFLDSTGIAPAKYLELLSTQAAQILAESAPGSYPHPLAAVTQLSMDRLTRHNPAAADLVRVCAFFAPEPIPAELFTSAPAKLPESLAQQVIDPLKWGHLTTAAAAESLVRIDLRGLQMHRLTQAIVRDQLSRTQSTAYRTSAQAILAISHPGNPHDQDTWAGWARLLPHLLVCSPDTGNPDLRRLMLDARTYLSARGAAQPQPMHSRRYMIPILAALAAVIVVGTIFALQQDKTARGPASTRSVLHGSRVHQHSAPAPAHLTDADPATFVITQYIPESVAFSPDGRTIAVAMTRSGGGPGSAYLWHLSSHAITPLPVPPESRGALSAAFSPDGTTLAVGDSNGATYLWNPSSATTTFTFHNPRSHGAQSVAFSPDGATLAVGDSNGTTYLWNLTTHKSAGTLPDPGRQGFQRVQAIAFSPDGTALAAADADGSTFLWNVAARKVTAALDNPASEGVQAVAFSRNGTTLAAGDADGKTYLWNLILRTITAALPDPGQGGVQALAFSPDGTTLAVGDHNGRTYLWNAVTSKKTATPYKTLYNRQEFYGVGSVAYSPSGDGTVAVSDHAGITLLWHLISA